MSKTLNSRKRKTQKSRNKVKKFNKILRAKELIKEKRESQAPQAKEQEIVKDKDQTYNENIFEDHEKRDQIPLSEALDNYYNNDNESKEEFKTNKSSLQDETSKINLSKEKYFSLIPKLNSEIITISFEEECKSSNEVNNLETNLGLDKIDNIFPNQDDRNIKNLNKDDLNFINNLPALDELNLESLYYSSEEEINLEAIRNIKTNQDDKCNSHNFMSLTDSNINGLSVFVYNNLNTKNYQNYIFTNYKTNAPNDSSQKLENEIGDYKFSPNLLKNNSLSGGPI